MHLTRIVTTLATASALVATGLFAGTAGAGGGHHDDPVVRTLTTFAAPDCQTGCGSGSTIGPDGALYVTDGAGGQVLRVHPRTGETTTFASGLPQITPGFGLGGAMDVIFLGRTAYVLTTLVGPEFGQPDAVAGIYRVDRHGGVTPVADLGAWSTEHPPETDYFVASGVQYAFEAYRGKLVVSDGHHNRVLQVSRHGDITELQTFGNTVPTGLEVDRGAVYMAEAGPIPHDPEDGRVIRFKGSRPATEVASGGPLLVDVEAGRHHRLYALAQGVWDWPQIPENEGRPASPDTGQLMRVKRSGELVPLVEGLDRPTSFEVRGDSAWVITLTGTVLRVDGL